MNESLTYEEATESSYEGFWVEVMKAEMQAFDENEAWTLVKIPKKNVIKGKWFFKVKENVKGKVRTRRLCTS